MELHKTEFSQSESGKFVDCSIPNKLLQLYAYIFFNPCNVLYLTFFAAVLEAFENPYYIISQR